MYRIPARFSNQDFTYSTLPSIEPGVVVAHGRNTGTDGLEVTGQLFDSPASIVFGQSGNRLHTIEAILAATPRMATPLPRAAPTGRCAGQGITEGSGMNRLTRRLVPVVAVLAAGGLAAGCAQGSNLKKAIASLSPSGNVTRVGAAGLSTQRRIWRWRSARPSRRLRA